MKNKISFIAILFTLFLQVNRANGQTLQVIDFNQILDGRIKVQNFNEYFNNESFIKLETIPESHFGIITQIESDGQRLFIMDHLGSLLAFDYSGKFLWKKESSGKGPGEYTNAWGFAIYPEIGELCLYDQPSRKIIHYNMDGEYLQENVFKKSIEQISVLDDHHLLLFSDGKYNGGEYHTVYIYGVADRCVIKQFEIYTMPQLDGPIYANPVITTYQGEAILKIPFCDTLYSINKKTCSAKYLIKTDHKDLPNRLFTNPEQYSKEKKNYIEIGRAYETGLCLFISFSFKDKAHITVLHKQTHQWNRIATEGDNPIKFLHSARNAKLPIKGFRNGVLISAIDATDFIEYFGDIQPKMVAQTKADDNPIIYIAHLRNCT